MNTALSTKLKKYCEFGICVSIIPRLLVKRGTFLSELWPDLREKRDILNIGNLDISGIGYWKSVHW